MEVFHQTLTNILQNQVVNEKECDCCSSSYCQQRKYRNGEEWASDGDNEDDDDLEEEILKYYGRNKEADLKARKYLLRNWLVLV